MSLRVCVPESGRPPGKVPKKVQADLNFRFERESREISRGNRPVSIRNGRFQNAIFVMFRVEISIRFVGKTYDLNES